MNLQPIIIIDDEVDTLNAIETMLESSGYENIIKCAYESAMWMTIQKYGASLVILDLIMPNSSGEKILKILKEDYPDIQVIISTGINELETAVRCMQNGAYDYLVKPVEGERLLSSVRNAIEMHNLQRNYEALSSSLLTDKVMNPNFFENIYTTDPKMIAIFKYIEVVATTSYPILITGETGVGKELIAEAIYNASGRNGKFVRVNVAGLDDNVFSDTLFGHLNGAFTGASQKRKGLVEEASNGTLFLDEIGDLSIASQVKLLRLLQEHEFRPLGSDTTKQSTCNIITATSRKIDDLANSSTFRRDLYYRLKIHHMYIPALREHKADIKILVNHFIKMAVAEYNKPTPTVPKELFTLLETWHFPGNVRELQALVFDAIARNTNGILSLKSFRSTLNLDNNPKNNITNSSDDEPIITFHDKLPTIKETNFLLLEEAMRRAKGNNTIAANLLGVTRQAVSQRLKNREK